MSIYPELLGKKFPTSSGRVPMTSGRPFYRFETAIELGNGSRERSIKVPSGGHDSEDLVTLLLVRVEPSDRAEELYRRIVVEVWLIDGVLELDADPAWAGPINTVLAKKGVTVSELPRAASF